MVFDDGGTAYTAEHRQHSIRGQQRLRSHQLPVARAAARTSVPPAFGARGLGNLALFWGWLDHNYPN